MTILPPSRPASGPSDRRPALLAVAASLGFTAAMIGAYAAGRQSRSGEDRGVPGWIAGAVVCGVAGAAISLAAAGARLRKNAPISAEQERARRRQVLAELIESIPEPVVVVERDDTVHLRIRTVNGAAVQKTGRTVTELAGRAVSSVIRDPAGDEGLLQRIERRGQISGRETRFVGTGGDLSEVSLTATPVDIDAAGGPTPTAWVIVASDVGDARRTERRRVATSRVFEVAQAAESPAELFRGIESVLRGAMEVDAFHVASVETSGKKLDVAYCSDPATPGVSLHEVQRGLSGYALVREAAVILNAEQIRLLVTRGEVKAAEPVAEHWASAPMRLGAGSRGVLVVQNRDRSSPYQNGDVDLLCFAAGQVAGWFRRRRLEEERQRLGAAVEQAVDAVLVLDENGRIEYANPAFERQTGFSRDETSGRELGSLWRTDEGSTPLAAVWQLVRSGRPWTGSVSCTRREGGPFPAQVTLAAVRERDGRVTEYVVIQHDMSSETELREQLQQSQKMEAVGILAGGVAHDFNNLLSVIHGYSEIAREGDNEEEREMCLKQVTDAARRASTLVGQLLAFSRRQVIKPQPLDLGAVVRDVEKMTKRLIGEDVELEIVGGEGLDLIEADPHKIEQVLMNLAVNARDAMPRGGRLTVSTAMEVLDAPKGGVEAGTWVVLSVRDTGVGMPPSVRSRIFEPFFTTKAKGHGTGLGLSTVYGIVKQAGGHIQVESEERRGTEFRIHLPSIGRLPAPAPVPEVNDARRGGDETILVVEDEAALRGFVERSLARHGYHVLTARNGADGVEVARGFEGPIDLLLTDVVMPGMNGSALAATLAEERPRTPVLYMSGYPDSSIASYGVLDPDVDLLQKPFTSSQLLQRVRRAMDAHRNARRKARRDALAATLPPQGTVLHDLRRGRSCMTSRFSTGDGPA